MASHVEALFPHARNLPTFRTAAESYLEHGGERRYLARIIDYLGDQPIATITPWDVKQMALALYPEATHSNNTRNRQALTPARAVLIHGYERGWCPLMRLKRFRPEPTRRKSPASQAWLHIFCRQCAEDDLPHLAALVLFMSHTGARVSEATRLCWSEVDLVGRKALLLKTKTDINSTRHLTDEIVGRLHEMAIGQPSDAPVFRYSSRYGVNDRIRAVCQRAGIPYKSSHACGRHSFASNAIAFGMDARSAMDAGGWKSSAVFLETYVHVKNAGRIVADRFNSFQFAAEI